MIDTTHIEVALGVSTNYMNCPVHVNMYSVIHNGKLVIRTSNRTTALYYYKLYTTSKGPAVGS